MIAALYVHSNGNYAGVPGVCLWDAARDALLLLLEDIKKITAANAAKEVK